MKGLVSFALLIFVSGMLSAEGIGVGGLASMTNQGWDDGTNTASTSVIGLVGIVNIPLGKDLELTPHASISMVSEKDPKDQFGTPSHDYSWNTFGAGATLYRILLDADSFRLLLGGSGGFSSGSGGDSPSTSKNSTMMIQASVPLTFDYRLSQSFVARASAQVLSANYYLYTSHPQSGKDYKYSNLEVVAFSSGVSVGFYYQF